jgi:hypothetical protein
MDGSMAMLGDYKVDEATHTMTFTRSAHDEHDPALKPFTGPITVSYIHPDADHLTLEGMFDGSKLRIELERLDASKMLLVSRGFHWINEASYNR